MRGVRGRKKHVFKPLSIVTSHTSPPPQPNPAIPKSSQPSESPIQSGESISPNTLAKHELFQQGLVLPVLDSSPLTLKHQKPSGLKLQAIDRTHHWKLISVQETLNIPKWFESQV